MNALRSRLVLIIAVVAVAAFASWLTSAGAARADDGPVKVAIRITDSGFEPKSIDVPLGALVELTFTWDQPGHPDDEHVIVIPGYKLESEKVDRVNKQTTLRFVASKTGPFLFKCDTECDVHDLLQAGTINVGTGTTSTGGAAATGATGGAATLQASHFVFDPVSGIVVNGTTVSVATKLLDANGKPIAKAEVAFFASRQFLGRHGEVPVASGKTDAAGNVYAIYHPTDPNGGTIIARFDGSGLYDKTEQTLNLAPSSLFQPVATATADDDLHGIKKVAPFVFIGVLAGVWCAFAFMLIQIRGISRARMEDAHHS